MPVRPHTLHRSALGGILCVCVACHSGVRLPSSENPEAGRRIEELVERLVFHDDDQDIDALLEIGPAALPCLRARLKTPLDETRQGRVEWVIDRLNQVVAWRRSLEASIGRWHDVLDQGSEAEAEEVLASVGQYMREGETLDGMGGFSWEPLFPILRKALARPEAGVRHLASVCAAMRVAAGFLPLWRECLSHSDASVRYHAVSAIAGLARDARYRSLVVDALRHAARPQEDAINVRALAAAYLCDLGEECDAQVFLDVLRHPQGNHALAAQRLARLGRRDCIELILVCLEAAGRDEGYECGEALASLTGQKFGRDSMAWRRWFESAKETLPEQMPWRD